MLQVINLISESLNFIDKSYSKTSQDETKLRIIKISMKAVLINNYIRINGKRVLLIILYKTLQCIIFFYHFLGLFLTSHLLLPLAFQSCTPVRTAGIVLGKQG